MKLSLNVFGVEVANLELDLGDQDDSMVEEIERRGTRLLGRVIGRISTAWVATGMRR